MTNTATITQTQVVAVSETAIQVITAGTQGPAGASSPIPNNTFLGNVSGATATPVALGVSTQQLLLNQAKQLPHWRAALGRVKSGTGNARVLFIGDSITMGYKSNGSTTGDMKPKSFPSHIANALNVNGILANAENFMGNGFATSGYGTAQWDSRISVGSGWNNSGVTNCFVGGEIFVASGSGGNLSFTPTQAVDTFRVYYWGYTGSGTLSLDINGSGTTNHSTDTGTAGSIQSFTITGTLGTNTVNVKWISGNVFVLGFEAYDSSKNYVACINAGWWGSASIDWSAMLSKGFVSNPISPLSPDLTVIMLGANDWNSSVSLTAFYNNLQAIITAAQVTGDVILVSDNITASGVDALTQLTYDQEILSLAFDNSIPFIDLWARWGAYTTVTATSMIDADNTHPTPAGYADIAEAVFEIIGATGVSANTGLTNITGLVSAGTNVTVSGSGTGASPYVISAAGGGGSPGGTTGQIQYNNAGSFGGVTVGGDGTLDTSTGALTVTKSGGTSFGTAAFDNTGTSGTTIPLNDGNNTFSGDIILTKSFTINSPSGSIVIAGGASSGTIDNIYIGGYVPSTGAFTTLTATSIYMSGGAIEEAVYANGNSGSSKTIAWNNGNLQTVTISAGCTFTFTAPTHPGKFTLIVTLGGAYTYTFPTVKWPSATQPTHSTTTSAIDIYSFIYDGTTYYGMGGTGFA